MMLVVKNSLAKTGDIRDTVSITRLGRSPGEGHGFQFQYSCLVNTMDRAVWWAPVHKIANSQTLLK